MKGQVKIITVILLIGISITIISLIFAFGSDLIDIVTGQVEEEAEQERLEDLASIAINDYYEINDDLYIEIVNNGRININMEYLATYIDGEYSELTGFDCPGIDYPELMPGQMCNMSVSMV